MDALRTMASFFSLSLLIGASIGVLLSLTLYRLFFHPLSKIPGPYLQCISHLPRILQCRNGDRHLQEMASHERYGSAVRVAPNSITFNTLSALQTIHAKDSNTYKGDEFYALLDGGAEGGRSITMTEKASDHAARRRVFDKALPPREQAFKILNDLAQLLASTIFKEAGSDSSKGWTAPVDISQIANWYSFDLITSISFGQSLNLLRDKEYRWAPGCLRDANIFLYWAGYAPLFLSFWRWLLGTHIPSLLRLETIIQTQKYMDFADEMFNKRKERMAAEKEEEEGVALSSRSDIFRHLLSTNLYSPQDLRADSSLLIAAGSDAIRLTIAATVFYWLKTPSVFSKVQAEIFSVPSPEAITDSQLSSLHYLRACVDETMRLCPPKAGSLPREVLAGGIVVDGVYVPKGATVGVSMYALHHDAEIYPEPYAYRPERWLEGKDDRRMREAFCPFLKGPRACPGKTVAYFAVELALFHLVRRYEISSGERNGAKGKGLRWREDEYQFNDWILGFANAPVIRLRERA